MLTLILSVWLALDGEEAGLMRANLTAVYVLQPYLSSPVKFRDPSNAAEIRAALDQLALLQHQFLGQRAEPTPAAISTLFAEQVKRSRADFDRGSADAARLRLRGLTAQCLGCHSRAASAQAASARATAEHLGLSAAERAQFLAATRQFDDALALWRELLATPPRNGLESYDQALALRQAVGVAVRVKDDPVLVLSLLDLAKQRGGLPPYAQRNAEAWAQQAARWRGEKRSAAAEAPAALFARAKALIEATPAAASVAPDEEHLVALQRAAAYLNRALALEPAAKWRGEALYLLAVASAAATDPELWQLDELYLEACVRENPHSRLAQRCADRFADRVVFQYTYAGQTQVPVDVGSRLGDLRALAR